MTEKLTPKLVATFETDADGAPIYIESGGKKHYKLAFEVENAPPDAYAATFELDPTFYDPRRTLKPDADGKFRLKVSSYGDFGVMVTLRSKAGEVSVANSVSRALREAASSAPANPKLGTALDYIASH